MQMTKLLIKIFPLLIVIFFNSCMTATDKKSIGNSLLQLDDTYFYKKNLTSFSFDSAFLNSYYQTGLKNLLDIAVLDAVNQEIKTQKLRFKKLDEVPFDFDRRRMSVVVKTPQNKVRMMTKGAVEEMLKVCRYVEIN